VSGAVPAERVRRHGTAPVRGGGDFVLYWMIAARRTRWNYALDRAAEHARELGLPVLVLEALRCDYPWASDRLHRFVLDGMRDNARALAGSGIGYHPYVEPERGAGKGLLAALAERAAVVVTDEFPVSFLPRMVRAAARKIPVALESVDSNGLLPLSAGREFSRAYDFRRFLQRHLAAHLAAPPRPSALRQNLPRFAGLPPAIERRWPAAGPTLLDARGAAELAGLPIDHSVAPAPMRGGQAAADRALRRFLDTRLERYGVERNDPSADTASGLSPYLHFGHLSPHRTLDAIARREGWSPARLSDEGSGGRSGWWGLPEGTEAFLDQLVTWRELGYGWCARRPDHAEYSALPDWARRTLAEHRHDERPHVYGLQALDAGRTHDPLWNAAQGQLRHEGRIHSYLRMLWGKKILHWTRTPETAYRVMLELNDRYALDGRDPNSLSGIGWVLGRFDRPWGPERPVFGKVRYMSSANTRRKLKVAGYVERWSGGAGPPHSAQS